VGNVQPLRPELASHALCQRTQARLRRGKVGEARFAAQAAGCAREDERAAPERRQPAGRLAADKEACKTADPPEILEGFGTQLTQVDALIVTGIENDEVGRPTRVAGRKGAIEQA
jgi:hypothetical protein